MSNNILSYTKLKQFFIENSVIMFFSVIYFLMMCTFISKMHFIDENDNFLGALMVTHGRDIYSHHISQHMPFAYYIFAIPAYLFGVHTVVAFRISFYIIMIIIWNLMYYRYKRDFGKIIMILYPVLYIFSMAYYQWGYLASSDQLQAQGLAILFFEFVLFIKDRNITYKSSLFISLAILLSFGTCFVSIFPIFVIVLAVLYLELKDLMHNKVNILKWPIYFFKKYWKLVLFILTPFIILIVWYAATKNLYNFYVGAYSVNRHLYSKYQPVGGNILKDVLTTFSLYSCFVRESFASLMVDGILSFKFIVLIGINITFFIFTFSREKNLTFFLVAFTLMLGIRGFLGFHTVGYLSVSFVMLCVILKEYFENIKSINILYYAIASLIFLSLSVQFFEGFPNMLDIKEAILNSDNIEENTPEFLIKKLTNPDEPIFVSTSDTEIFIKTNRLPIYTPSSPCPWMWEVNKSKDYNFLNNYKPKVMYFKDEYIGFSCRLKDYAPDFIEYVHENYTLLSNEYPELYVRKDFLKDAKEMLGKLRISN